MSSDDELFEADPHCNRPFSGPPPSAQGLGPESPTLDNNNIHSNLEESDRRGSVNGIPPSTAHDIANSDESVRQVLYSDVRSPESIVNLPRRLD